MLGLLSAAPLAAQEVFILEAPVSWEAFTCEDGSHAFLSEPSAQGEVELVHGGPAQTLLPLDTAGVRGYGGHGVEVRLDSATLIIEMEDESPPQRCSAGVEPADGFVGGQGGLRFLPARPRPIPGGQPVRVKADNADNTVLWLSPEGLRVEPNELDSVWVAGAPYTGLLELHLSLNTAAARRFASLTGANVGFPLAVVVDSHVVAAPRVLDRIPDGRLVISGQLPKEARQIEAALRRLIRQ